MTQEEKQLLFKDLCARLPYGVVCKISYTFNNETTNWEDVESTCDDIITKINFDTKEVFSDWLSEYSSIDDVKPYLRPMSSMTEEEREEIEVFIFDEWYQEDSCKIDKEGWIEILANYDVSGIDPCFCSDYVDWLNAHHFDYRKAPDGKTMIEAGLAIEAPEDMYEKKKN